MQSERPVSAVVSAGGQTTRSWGGGSSSSYFEDRQSVFSLTGTGAAPATGQERPLGGLLNTLVDAAHQAHDNRKLLHPSTYAYSIFNWKVQESAQRTGQATASEASLVRSYASSTTAATAPTALQPSIPGTHNTPQRARLGSLPAEEITMSAVRLRANSVGGSSYTGSRTSSAHTVQTEFIGPAPDLEVVCLYDSNFQAANQRGQHGVPLRGLSPATIGPISYLYRWYCKRATHFAGGQPAALPDAPTMPLPDEPPRPSAAPGGGVLRSSSAVSRLAQGQGQGRGGSPGGSPSHGRPPTTSGRRLNRSVDPLINLSELVEMLEDLQVVPQLASRADVHKLFAAAKAACSAAATAAAAAAAASIPPATTRSASPAAPLPPDSLQATPRSARGGSGSGASGTATPRAPALAAWEASDRPRSASVPSRAMVAAGGPSGGDSRPPSAAAVGRGPATVPKAQVAPEDIRFPVFLDFFVRLAVGIGCIDLQAEQQQQLRRERQAEELRLRQQQQQQQKAAAGAAGLGARPSSGGGGNGPSAADPRDALLFSLLPPHSAEAVAQGAKLVDNVNSGRWGREVNSEQAAAAVLRLLERIGARRTDMAALKQQLDLLARMAGEHGARKKENKALYVHGPSCVAAAQNVGIAASPPPSGLLRPAPAPGAPPVAAGAAVGTTYGSPPHWNVLSHTPAPQFLLGVLAAEDRGNAWEYRPAWREFGAEALDLGVLQPGELRLCRLVLHNRGTHQMSVRVDGSSAPFASCSYSGLHCVLPGIPKHVDVSVQLQEPGEVVGDIRLLFSSAKEPAREQEVVVPVYAMVGLPGSNPTERRVPTARSERSALASKAGSGRLLPKAVAAAAALSPQLPHHAPPRRASSTASGSTPASVSLAGGLGTGAGVSLAGSLLRGSAVHLGRGSGSLDASCGRDGWGFAGSSGVLAVPTGGSQGNHWYGYPHDRTADGGLSVDLSAADNAAAAAAAAVVATATTGPPPGVETQPASLVRTEPAGGAQGPVRRTCSASPGMHLYDSGGSSEGPNLHTCQLLHRGWSVAGRPGSSGGVRSAPLGQATWVPSVAEEQGSTCNPQSAGRAFGEAWGVQPSRHGPYDTLTVSVGDNTPDVESAVSRGWTLGGSGSVRLGSGAAEA